MGTMGPPEEGVEYRHRVERPRTEDDLITIAEGVRAAMRYADAPAIAGGLKLMERLITKIKVIYSIK